MYTAILLLPLLGALIAGFAHRATGEKMAMWIPTGILLFCMVLSWIAFFSIGEEVRHVRIMQWIASGDLVADWTIRIDMLTGVMLVVVTTVSALVHLYSVGYMEEDDGKPRFFAYLSFFTFAMLALVTGDNLLQIFFGWEGVGVASYLLIGFWYKKKSANAAAIKAFIVNRVGDFGFLLGIFALFYLTGSIYLEDVFAAAPEMAETQLHFLWRDWNAVELVCVLLFIGAMGKSAQILLHTWLPDAMEGPTPVSALIHAATMVTAGVFLVCRMSPLYEFAPAALTMVVYVGAITAFFAATVGLVQNDIKRVIAYSTCSQLGYMFAAAGVGAYEAAMFHLFTHAFFKELLFLGAGSVIHAMHHEQDMRKMGGLRHKIPLTYWMMVIGTLSITGVGIPFLYLFDAPVGLAGFLSKDVVIETTWAANSEAGQFAFFLLVASAAMTAFYSWRLIFMTFHGRTHADHHTYDHAHESPNVMMIPLYVLATGAVLAGVLFYGEFVGYHEDEFWGPAIFASETNHVLHDAHDVPWLVKLSPFLAMLVGLGTAYWFYIASPALPARLAERHRPLYEFLLNKWYFDELYDLIFVRPAMWIGRMLWKKGDGATIDGAINGLAMGLVPWLTRYAGRAQSGYLFHYAFAMLIGLSLLITWFAIAGGGGGAE
ncbi:MAG TPA: NADH-quinone oxidoreductase subunit L [Thermohalobaculum sp.]|nr:NADH-quinone oxidoreductase subunit L [Thermohalobaculum sp.]